MTPFYDPATAKRVAGLLAKATDFKAERFLVVELAALDVVAVKSIFSRRIPG